MNYSKWDKFVAEQSDSDTEQNLPTVKTVKNNEVVRLGPQGYDIAQLSSSTTLSTKKSAEISVQNSSVSECIDINEAFLSKNGSKGSNYYWRQDRQEVIVSIVLADKNVKGKHIKLEFEPSNRLFSVYCETGSGAITTLFAATFRYGVDTESMTKCSRGDKRQLYEVSPEDWEIKVIDSFNGVQAVSSSSSGVNVGAEAGFPANITLTATSTGTGTDSAQARLVEVTFRKVSPLPGAIFWWRSCFEGMGEAEIDVTKISGRSQASSIGCGTAAAQEDPYVVAQRMFVEKMKTMEKVEVDC
jgi:hypothetical protein